MKTISFIIIMLSSRLVFAQIEAKTIDFSNRLEISLQKETHPQPLGDKIYAVNVIDARDDSGAVGYYYIPKREALKHSIPKSNANPKVYDVWSKVYYLPPTLKDGLSDWISTYLNCTRNNAARHSLLVVVKKLWLSSEADEIRLENDRVGQGANGWDAGVLCKLEFYLEKDSMFYPLYRVDSVFTFKGWLHNYAGFRFEDNSGSFITSALKNSLVKLAGINPDDVAAKRKKISFAEIQKEYSKKTELPVLKTAMYRKGVYKDFEEFRSNAPSIAQYELREGSMGDILYVKEGVLEYPNRNAWGFCDGTDIFINSGDKYSRLTRRENTFYFYGIKSVVTRSKNIGMSSSGLNYATGTGPKKTVFKLDLKYYQLDMETGEAY